MKAWVEQVLIALDQLLNALAGGWADETISARSWRCRNDPTWGIARKIVDVVFFWQVHHCEGAYASEKLRLQSPPEER